MYLGNANCQGESVGTEYHSIMLDECTQTGPNEYIKWECTDEGSIEVIS